LDNPGQSDDKFYTSHSGLALIGLCINRYSDRPQQVGRKMTKGQDKISYRAQHAGPALPRQERLRSYICHARRYIFQTIPGDQQCPSAERLRQRLDEDAETFLPIIYQAVENQRFREGYFPSHLIFRLFFESLPLISEVILFCFAGIFRFIAMKYPHFA
jgi:hypothetical protein